MKKKIIIGLALVSALSFGATNNNTTNQTQMWNNNGQRGMYQTQMMNNLSESQQKELFKMMEDRRDVNYKNSLDIRAKELELEKLLAADKVNWKSIEKVNNQLATMKAKQRLEGMKYRKSIEDKFGISMGNRRVRGNGSMMSNNRGSRNNGNKMNNGNRMNGQTRGNGYRNN